MAAAKKVRMRVLLGKDGLLPEPLIAGGYDEDTYENLDEGEWEYIVEQWKRVFESEAVLYEWREVWLTIPADKLAQVFEPRPVPAEIEA